MKKNLLITAIFCVSIALNIYAQCTPDPAVVSAGTPGLFPTPADGIASGTVGTAYAQTFTMIVPADTTVNMPPAPPTTVTINSATVTAVTGLPTGLTHTCAPSSCIYPGNSNGCFIIDGTPSVAGTFSVTVTVVVNINAPIVGTPTDLPAQDIVYTLDVADTGSGGCTMTITASSSDETAAGANDGTASVVAANGTGPYVYLWSTGATTYSVSGLAPGTYTVQVWDADTSCNATASVTVLSGPVGIGTVKGASFEIYPVTPNPLSDQAEIRFTVPDYREVRITLHNMIGAVVVSKRIYAEKGLNKFSLNAENLKPGVYFVTLTDGTFRSTRRMVVGAK